MHFKIFLQKLLSSLFLAFSGISLLFGGFGIFNQFLGFQIFSILIERSERQNATMMRVLIFFVVEFSWIPEANSNDDKMANF